MRGTARSIDGIVRGTLHILPLPPIVRELMAVCATSALSECVYFASRVVVTHKIARFTVESIETLVTVMCWLRENKTKWYDNVHDEDVNTSVVADEMV